MVETKQEYLIGIYAQTYGEVCHITNRHNLVERVVSVTPDRETKWGYWIFVKADGNIIKELQDARPMYTLILPY